MCLKNPLVPEDNESTEKKIKQLTEGFKKNLLADIKAGRETPNSYSDYLKELSDEERKRIDGFFKGVSEKEKEQIIKTAIETLRKDIEAGKKESAE